MTALGLSDIIWLIGESRERPFHVGGLLLFDLPQGLEPADVRAAMRSADAPVQHPFDQRLARPYGRAGRFRWVDDEVDLEHHVRHVALPAPGRIRELLAYVSQQHGSLLDRHRPLWEAVLIEGVEGDRIALYTKVHHAMIDGVGAMRQLTHALSTDADERDMPPPWSTPPRPRRRRDGLDTSVVQQALDLVATSVREGLGAATTVAKLGAQVVAGASGGPEVVPYAAPRSMLNVRTTSARRIVAQSYDIDRFRGIATRYDATVNDVVLAVCGGALRAYLQSHDALPDDPLVAFVPVSIRTSDGDDAANAVSMMLASLATDVGEPVERLERVKASMSAGKARLAGMSQTQLVEYAALLLAPMATSQVLRVGVGQRPLFNVVISNVPGPREPLYWNGAQLTGMYPLSAIADGYALNITLVSYAGSLEFGITADRTALPRVQRLIDHIEDAVAELEAT
ncbi:WS/DGAT/MGAT family O-acyltransferase [Nitriliruptor alkaliphilus]|uniref:WS/DGAT/MGAT family O-acyltransferase n=1 Tax=Nitriliruptor alkaliphilus TaxID=427918 RepID=UPI000697FAE2|nr:wax ester/triacylglycerol synthase family O-acyltransferase [Nitriliruptor alkaliphilus]